MRLAIPLCILLLSASPSAASATPRRPAADAAGLRGEVSTDAPADAPSAAAAKQRKPATASLATSPPADSGQCRLACAHTYYQCLSGDDAERCPQEWTLCLAACSRQAAGLR